jgi:enamine deaminase RidA (YjgF/YER057c/UK114 family)
MADTIAGRMRDLGIELPIPQPPKVARILPFSRSGTLLFVSGQLPQWNGEIRYRGKLGKDFDLEQGRQAARLSALNVLAQTRAALGDLERVDRIHKVSGFVNCTPDFEQVAEVVNGASELFVAIFGERGAHARVAVGAANMPMGVAVEIEAIIGVAER